MDYKTLRLFDLIHHQNNKYPQDIAFADKVNGEWVTHSTQQIIDMANAFSRGLLAMGIKPGDKIAMISNNRSEWNIADIAILQIGAINVPVYPTISAEDYVYIFNHAEIKLALTGDLELADKVKSINDRVETLDGIYTFDKPDTYPHWLEISARSEEVPFEEVKKISDTIKPGDLATIIYTSGTTGKPKGVMLSHTNLASNVVNALDRLPVDNRHKALSFLPVSHVYERMLLYLYTFTGLSVYFAESLDTIGDNLKEVKPHIFTMVPRLLEKVYDKIIAKGSDLTGIKRKLFFWAVELGHKYKVEGNPLIYRMKLSIAKKLIFSKWQEALGGNVMAAVSGSAALQPRLARVFLAAGIPIYEGYGLTETSPVISTNYADGLRIGTVGTPLKEEEVVIAEDGEILVKGPNVMMGYYKNDEMTKQVIDENGFFHTGDIGEVDADNYLKITDRKKEIFKTSGGKYIAPQLMENKFKESRFIEQIMVIGEAQKHPAALIVPSFEFLMQWCERKGIEGVSTNEEAIKHEAVIARIAREVETYNEFYGSWEKIKKFELIATEWTIETGELTPSLKLKRKIIKEKFKALYDKIYEIN